MTYVALFSSPPNPAVAFLFFVLVSIFSGSFSFLALLSLSLHSSALCSLGCMSCFRRTCKFRAAIASSESAANTAGGPRREEGARPKPGEDSRIEIARPLPRRDDECSRSDLRNVPGISSRDTVSRDPLLRNHSPTWRVPSPGPPLMPYSSCTPFFAHARGRCSPLLLPGSDCYLKLCAPLIQHAIAFVPEVLISFFRARPSGVEEYKVTRSVRVINLPCRRLYIRYFHYFPPEYSCHEK